MAKRGVLWLQSEVDFVALAGATTEFNMSAVSFEPQNGNVPLRGWTLTRMIGEMMMRPTAGVTVGVLKYASVVMLQGGSTSPDIDPGVDNADYLWWYGGATGLEGSEQSTGSFGAFSRYIRIDSRAQRIVKGNEQHFYFVFKNDAAQSCTVNFHVRCLFKLP